MLSHTRTEPLIFSLCLPRDIHQLGTACTGVNALSSPSSRGSHAAAADPPTSFKTRSRTCLLAALEIRVEVFSSRPGRIPPWIFASTPFAGATLQRERSRAFNCAAAASGTGRRACCTTSLPLLPVSLGGARACCCCCCSLILRVGNT